MNNVNVVVKPDETVNDIIEQICQSENLGYDDPFAFSAIMTPSKRGPGYRDLKINCIEPSESNPFTPVSLIKALFASPPKSVMYVVPPLEIYLTTYRPMLHKMVNKAFPHYQRLIPDKEDLMSILLYSIVKLNSKGYYLHNNLIYKSFVNELNMEVRKLKNFNNTISFDTPLGQEEDGKIITLADIIPDEKSSEIARQQMHYTEKDYWEDMFKAVKSTMLEDMSQLSFDRILIQLKSRTVDTRTSRTLTKYREEFNPDACARRGKKK